MASYLSSPAGDISLHNIHNLSTFMLDRMEKFGDKAAVIDPDKSITVSFMDMARNIRRTAHGLRKLGVKKGDVICMGTGNCVEYYYVFYAVSMVEAVITTINPTVTARELKVQLEESQATCLIVNPQSIDVAKTMSKDKDLNIRDVFVIGESAKNGFRSFEEIIANGSDDAFDDKSDLDSVFHIPFSSGTTGKSKGVLCQQKMFVANVLMFSNPMFQHLKDSDTLITFIPLYHIYGQLMVMTYALWTGVTNILMSRFKLDNYLSLIQQYRCTVSYIVPPVAIFLLKSPALLEEYNLTSLRLLVSAAATLAGNLETELKSLLKLPAFIQIFGMSEIGFLFAIPNDGQKAGSTGKILPGNQVQVLDIDTGNIQSANQEGKIRMKGPATMLRYLNHTDTGFSDEGNWFKTGDLGYYDDDGYFFITGRMKDLIKYNCQQVSSAELEAILLSHPAVDDAAVIGVAHPTAGEVPRAYVVLATVVDKAHTGEKPQENTTAGGTQADNNQQMTATTSTVSGDVDTTKLADEISRFVSERVAPYKRLRGGVHFIDEIPKSAAGKILKRVLKAKADEEEITAK